MERRAPEPTVAAFDTADGQIVVSQDDGEARLPLEDVAYVILDTPHATLTSTLLSACVEAGIVIVTTTRATCRTACCCRSTAHHRQAGDRSSCKPRSASR